MRTIQTLSIMFLMVFFASTTAMGQTPAQVNAEILALQKMNLLVADHLAKANTRHDNLRAYLKSIDKLQEGEAYAIEHAKDPHAAQMTFDQALAQMVSVVTDRGANIPQPDAGMTPESLTNLRNANKVMVQQSYDKLMQVDFANNLLLDYLSSINKVTEYRVFANDRSEDNQQQHAEQMQKNQEAWIAQANEEQKAHHEGMVKLAAEEKQEQQQYWETRMGIAQEELQSMNERYIASNFHPVYNWNGGRYGELGGY